MSFSGPFRTIRWDRALVALARSVTEHTHEVERNYGQLLAEEGDLLAVAESFYQAHEWSQLKAIWPALSGYLWNVGDLSLIHISEPTRPY